MPRICDMDGDILLKASRKSVEKNMRDGNLFGFFSRRSLRNDRCFWIRATHRMLHFATLISVEMRCISQFGLTTDDISVYQVVQPSRSKQTNDINKQDAI